MTVLGRLIDLANRALVIVPTRDVVQRWKRRALARRFRQGTYWSCRIWTTTRRFSIGRRCSKSDAQQSYLSTRLPPATKTLADSVQSE